MPSASIRRTLPTCAEAPLTGPTRRSPRAPALGEPCPPPPAHRRSPVSADLSARTDSTVQRKSLKPPPTCDPWPCLGEQATQWIYVCPHALVLPTTRRDRSR